MTATVHAWVRQLNIFGTVLVGLALWGAVCVVLVPVLVAMLVRALL